MKHLLAVLACALVLAACVPITPEPAPTDLDHRTPDNPTMQVDVNDFARFFARNDENQLPTQEYADLMVEIAYCFMSEDEKEELAELNSGVTEGEWNAFRYFQTFIFMGLVLTEDDEDRANNELPMYQMLQATLAYCHD